MAIAMGRLIVISAPSGCGKTTIVERLLERNKKWMRSVSYTTRPPRPGEESGKDYFFISQEEFRRKEQEGFFLESAEVFNHSYGTSKQFVMDRLASGRDVILAVDIQGMKEIKKRVSGECEMVSIFIMPPSAQALKRRLMKRKTETKKEIAKRLEVAQQEMSERTLYDHVVVNRRVDQAVKAIEEVLK